MWEEDPRWQAASFRLWVKTSVVTIVLVSGWLAVLRDWEMLVQWLGLLAGVAGAFLVYAAAICLMGHGVRWVARAFRRLSRRGTASGSSPV